VLSAITFEPLNRLEDLGHFRKPMKRAENENTNFCNFYDVEKFTKSKFNSGSNFSILHLNIA
jgi:hypothetical protein